MFTRSTVEARLEEAATTLKHLPDPPGSGPKGFGSSWPDYVRDPWHAYGYHAARARIVPSAAEISRMEEALGWLGFLSAEDARIVWWRASGMRWAQVGRRLRISRSQCWRRWVAALITLTRHLNGRRRTATRRPVNGDGAARQIQEVGLPLGSPAFPVSAGEQDPDLDGQQPVSGGEGEGESRSA